MACWLWSIPAHNYPVCRESGTFAIRKAGINAIKRVAPGDRIFAYIPGKGVIAGVFRATTAYFHDTSQIWADGIYPHRVRVEPEILLPEESQVPLDAFKDRLRVGRDFPNFGLVIQKVVIELVEADAEILDSLVRGKPTVPIKPPPTPPPEPPLPIEPAKEHEKLLRDLHQANQKIGLLQRKILDLEALLALAGPNLEDYLRLANSSEGTAFEEATRKCLVALGFTLDTEYQGQPGEIDLVATAPYYVFGECQASSGPSIGVGIVDKLLRHRRRYLGAVSVALPDNDARVVVCETATDQLVQDARTEGVTILRPSQLAALVKLKREYPGALHPYNLQDVLATPGDITSDVIALLDRIREEVEKRVGIIEVLKNDRYARLGRISGRDPGWIQARLEAELETHLTLAELKDILHELTSPLVGCVGTDVSDTAPPTYYYIRDYDFQLASPEQQMGEALSKGAGADPSLTWDDELMRVINQRWNVGERFTLNEVYEFEEHFSQLYPANRHIRDKIRQTLQNLRDMGLIQFVESGVYRRIA